VLGLDTGFFVKLLGGDEKARALWREVGRGTKQAAVSCISFFELDRLTLRGKLDRASTNTLLNALPHVCVPAWIGNAKITQRAARFSHSAGLPAVDALILASLIEEGAKTVYTTDDWETVREKGIKIIKI
jgi:predicted nucleic acid-binding protein